MQNGKDIVLRQSILRTLLYFDLFKHPLKSEEIFRFLGTNSVTVSDLEMALDDLVGRQLAFQFNGFYSVRPGEDIVKRRQVGNKYAQRISDRALSTATFIGKFPFVRGVMASGSFSKGYMDADSDLDFFIVTAPGRLWIARMFIALYKRIILLNSHKYFCCNYFIALDDLRIAEKNLFTATELATLIPLSGASSYTLLVRANPWLKEFFPNFLPRNVGQVPEAGINWFKRLVERLLSGKAGDRLTEKCRQITQRRWKRLYGEKYSNDDFDIAFKSTASVSKNHPNHFQRRILERYDEKLRDFSREKVGLLLTET